MPAARPNEGPPAGAGAPGAPTLRHHTTRSVPAYDPPHADISRPWQRLVAGLLLAAVLAGAVHPVCLPEARGRNERAAGVRHERRGAVWYHCEPWIRRAFDRS
jgi:hypothetical protein